MNPCTMIPTMLETVQYMVSPVSNCSENTPIMIGMNHRSILLVCSCCGLVAFDVLIFCMSHVDPATTKARNVPIIPWAEVSRPRSSPRKNGSMGMDSPTPGSQG